MSAVDDSNPCISCGACCAAFRVDFSSQELRHEGGCVPEGLAERLNDGLYRMRGTDYTPPRCAALSGKIGEQVRCGIYEWRPNPCHELQAGTSSCNYARRQHGLAALTED